MRRSSTLSKFRVLCLHSKGYSWCSFTTSYLADESDVNVLIKAIRFSLNLARTEPLASALELQNLEPAADSGDYWLGDADPSKVRGTSVTVYYKGRD